MQEYMAFRIDALDRICGLSEKQRKKLNDAAKDAIERVVTDTFGPTEAVLSNNGETGELTVIAENKNADMRELHC